MLLQLITCIIFYFCHHFDGAVGLPDWPEDQMQDVLHFFDNLNPKQTEQSRVALTCKLVEMLVISVCSLEFAIDCDSV